MNPRQAIKSALGMGRGAFETLNCPSLSYFFLSGDTFQYFTNQKRSIRLGETPWKPLSIKPHLATRTTQVSSHLRIPITEIKYKRIKEEEKNSIRYQLPEALHLLLSCNESLTIKFCTSTSNVTVLVQFKQSYCWEFMEAFSLLHVKDTISKQTS